VLNLLKTSISSTKKRSKAYFDFCVRFSILTCSMQKNISPFIRLCNIFFCQGQFQIIYQAGMKFWKIIKYLSTFYIRRFKRAVSNQRNVHRRFPTTTWIEDRSVLTWRAKEVDENAKNYDIHSSERLIYDRTNENASAWLVVCCQRWCSAFTHPTQSVYSGSFLCIG